MPAPISFLARRVVRAYRDLAASPMMGISPLGETVLARLEANDDTVPAALQRLRAERRPILLFYLIQAVEVAESAERTTLEIGELLSTCLQDVNAVERLYESAAVRANVSMHLREALPRIAQELREAADHYMAVPSQLGINRKSHSSVGAQLLALRHFVRCLRDNFKINCGEAKTREACVWLVESALNCTITPSRAAQAIRVVFSRSKSGIENTKRASGLKSKSKISG
jgi:hypothetical protein